MAIHINDVLRTFVYATKIRPREKLTSEILYQRKYPDLQCIYNLLHACVGQSAYNAIEREGERERERGRRYIEEEKSN